MSFSASSVQRLGRCPSANGRPNHNKNSPVHWESFQDCNIMDKEPSVTSGAIFYEVTSMPALGGFTRRNSRPPCAD